MSQMSLPIASGIVLAMALLVSSCNPNTEAGVIAVQQPVKVASVMSSSPEPVRQFPGRIAAAESSNVASKVAGQVTQVYAQPGDEVEKGDLLLQLDTTDYQLNLDQAKANYDLAKVSFERLRSSYEKGVTTQANYDQAKANYELTRVGLTMAENQLANTKIYAPFSGLVVRVNPKVYDFIAAGQPLMYLQSAKELDVKFQVPSDIVARIHADIEQEIVEVVFDALPEQRFTAKVKEFAADSDRSTRSFDVTLSLPRPPESLANLLPGMDATVLLDLSKIDPETVLTVPSHAVFQQGGNSYVWRIQENTAVRTAVVLGNLLGDRVEIKTGLNAGDTLVVAGVHKLSDGQTVSVWRGE